MNDLLQNIQNTFKNIEFNEEKHLYSVNGSPLNTSVSGRIKQYYTPFNAQEEAVVKFWKELPEHIILVGVEIRMYHFSLLYPGTMNILLFDTKNQTYIIADYKTNKDLFKNLSGTLVNDALNKAFLKITIYP